jgi:hypothetical protein
VRDKLQPVEDSDLSENPVNPIISGCRIKPGMTVLGLFTRLSMLIFKGSSSFIKILKFLVNMHFTNNPCLRADTHRQALYHFPITQYSIPAFVAEATSAE